MRGENKFIVFGINYRTSSRSLGEDIFLSQANKKLLLNNMMAIKAVSGAVILQTCHRFEIYLTMKYEYPFLIDEILVLIADITGYDAVNVLYENFYSYENEDALGHLLKVSAGLDSVLLGENQIFHQVKSAYDFTLKNGYAGRYITGLFIMSEKIIKRIRSGVEFYRGRISLGGIIKKIIDDKFDSLNSKTVLIIGLGKLNNLVIKYLLKDSPEVILIANRSFNKAKKITNMIKNSRAVRFDNLKESVKKADIVISASSAPHKVLKEKHLKGRPSKKLIIFDLAVPKDVERSIGEYENVELITLDKIMNISSINSERKQLEANAILKLIEKEVKALWPDLSKSVQEQVLLHSLR